LKLDGADEESVQKYGWEIARKTVT